LPCRSSTNYCCSLKVAILKDKNYLVLSFWSSVQLVTKVQCHTYSQACHNVILILGPNGCFSFMSRFYGGRITDNQLVTDCGVIEKVEPDDEFMADKGFPKVNHLNCLKNSYLSTIKQCKLKEISLLS
jgi:hypothetical protein